MCAFSFWQVMVALVLIASDSRILSIPQGWNVWWQGNTHQYEPPEWFLCTTCCTQISLFTNLNEDLFNIPLWHSFSSTQITTAHQSINQSIHPSIHPFINNAADISCTCTFIHSSQMLFTLYILCFKKQRGINCCRKLFPVESNQIVTAVRQRII